MDDKQDFWRCLRNQSKPREEAFFSSHSLQKRLVPPLTILRLFFLLNGSAFK